MQPPDALAEPQLQALPAQPYPAFSTAEMARRRGAPEALRAGEGLGHLLIYGAQIARRASADREQKPVPGITANASVHGAERFRLIGRFACAWQSRNHSTPYRSIRLDQEYHAHSDP